MKRHRQHGRWWVRESNPPPKLHSGACLPPSHSLCTTIFLLECLLCPWIIEEFVSLERTVRQLWPAYSKSSKEHLGRVSTFLHYWEQRNWWVIVQPFYCGHYLQRSKVESEVLVQQHMVKNSIVFSLQLEQSGFKGQHLRGTVRTLEHIWFSHLQHSTKVLLFIDCTGCWNFWKLAGICSLNSSWWSCFVRTVVKGIIPLTALC